MRKSIQRYFTIVVVITLLCTFFISTTLISKNMLATTKNDMLYSLKLIDYGLNYDEPFQEQIMKLNPLAYSDKTRITIIDINGQVLADTEDYFTLKLLCYQGAGSGYQWNYYYTIDLNTGERLQLKDVFVEGADYISVISENIKKQMREQMAADENVYYWLEDEIEEWNFNSITDETLFYMNEKGSVVISFNEGDVAPMYMGVVEFEIEDSVIKDIRK